ncbi:hypothetical protein U9M48_025243 [Paspalum notatum var. saurae]|uniref:Uncharacterized protein n=1 Tax=Paspalum notatum var. saurae TaxID=547442 RepID=A0AAQ3WXB8_PASNO
MRLLTRPRRHSSSVLRSPWQPAGEPTSTCGLRHRHERGLRSMVHNTMDTMLRAWPLADLSRTAPLFNREHLGITDCAHLRVVQCNHVWRPRFVRVQWLHWLHGPEGTSNDVRSPLDCSILFVKGTKGCEASDHKCGLNLLIVKPSQLSLTQAPLDWNCLG